MSVSLLSDVIRYNNVLTKTRNNVEPPGTSWDKLGRVRNIEKASTRKSDGS